MKIVLFAGGSGTRFWPISRNKYPKQFIPLIDNKSTLQMLLENLSGKYGWNNILVPTTELLSAMVKNSFPQLPLKNIITEPVRRDLAPAVGLAMINLRKQGGGDEAMAILWSDGIIKNNANFFKAMDAAEELINEDDQRLIWLGEKPTYPNENLGWLELGEKIAEKNGLSIFKRKSFTYRPKLEQAKKWFKNKTHLWNPGYFIATPNFILKQYEKLMPEMYKQLQEIEKSLDSEHENDVLQKIYPEMENISFDDAILVRMPDKANLVLAGSYQWNDPGTLYALKQFLQENQQDNVSKGLVYNYETKDSLVYNFVKKQLVATIGLEGFIVVNTPDAILVCHKNRIPDIKKLLKEFDGTELEKFL